ncbi:MAG: InlB B-repeat-containing protein, partial [Clostridiales bacterium]|nr:InlB B-repeat-containing protein [Clostridiales bacterium]
MERKNAFRSCKVIPALILLCLFLACLVISPCVRAVITHDVIFVMNGYGTAPATQHVNDGEKASRPADPYVMGVRFDGWYREASCENKFDFSTPIKQKTYIYAKWTRQCKITFDMNGHGTPIDPKYAWVDETIDSPTPTDPDYVFMGWYADKYYQNLFDFSKPVGKDLTLYAQWALKITITYDAGGATKGPNWIDSVTVPFSTTISGTVAKPDASVVQAQPGYEFVGFEIDGTLYKVGQSYSYQVGYNFTVKYVWKNVTKYKITVTGGKAYSEKARTNVITEGMQGDPVFVSYDTPASGKYVTDILYEGKSIDIFDYDGGLVMPAKEVTFTIVTADRKTATVDLRSGSGKLSEDAYVYNRPYGASITIPPVKNEIDLDGDGTKDITVTWNPGDPEAAVTKNAGTNL